MGCRDASSKPERDDRDLPQPDPPVVEEPDPEPEPEGKLSSTECRDYTFVSIYHDGANGFYEESEEKSEECGYIPDSLYVSIDNDYGDRFRPVIVYIDYTVNGVGAEFEFGVPYGEVKESQNYLEIYGDGQRHEDLVLTVNGEEFLYQLYPEPRCGKIDLSTDCEGYRYTGAPDGYIYYGDDDDQVVEWQLGYVYYDNTLQPYEFVQSDGNDSAWREADYMVRRMNKVYEDSGVHVRLVLEPSAVGYGRYMNNTGHTQMARKIGTADVGLGRGITCLNAGGCARVNTYFSEHTGFTLTGTIGRANAFIGLHEIGHTVGLAHGPDNSAYASEGYIWPDFGHGYSEPMCSDQNADVMSYAYRAFVHHNSQRTCGNGWPAGDRSYADSAYHLNRVRYDVSLVGRAEDAPPAFMEEAPETGPLVLD